jgi:hypothetical protein
LHILFRGGSARTRCEFPTARLPWESSSKAELRNRSWLYVWLSPRIAKWRIVEFRYEMAVPHEIVCGIKLFYLKVMPLAWLHHPSKASHNLRHWGDNDDRTRSMAMKCAGGNRAEIPTHDSHRSCPPK